MSDTKVRTFEKRYSPAEAAELMSLTKETVLRAIRSQALAAKRVGKGYRVKASDLEHWYDGLDDA